MNIIILVILSFIAGYMIKSPVDDFISMYKKRDELYETYLRKQKECPHGYDDWDDCPDCCH